ncbi:type I restriction endonuclease [Ponticaulis profundi]|uniref:Type I restriction endonuclease n=1 Tax=Ponticaulis profundi TaxID=2665222 RepID=A0ABW1S9Z3_9PROT
MSFEEKLLDLSKLCEEQKAHLLTEEAVKTSIVLRMFQSLGFDPFNPREVIPEFTADVGIKKGEKVDYAIRIEGNVAILIECKSPDQVLNLKHASQLYRYFSVTDARFAVLTNGFEWQFYTDLDQSNKMDQKPFLTFKLESMDATAVSELSKFQKDQFDEEKILSTAANLKYVSALKSVIRKEIETPSPELVTLWGRHIYEGRFTAQIQEQFTALLKRSFSEVLRDKVNARLSNALQRNYEDEVPLSGEDQQSEIETTDEEMEGYRIVVAIAAKVVNPDRVFIRDQKSYCGVLLDDNNRKPIVRLWFNSKTKKYVGLFDNEAEEKVSIDQPADIYKFADRICAALETYES